MSIASLFRRNRPKQRVMISGLLIFLQSGFSPVHSALNTLAALRSVCPVPCKLSVNVNAIAYLRNRRGLPWPSVVELSRAALDAGAAGITVHPRPDERHIRRADVTDISRLLR